MGGSGVQAYEAEGPPGIAPAYRGLVTALGRLLGLLE
jgi:hypothetical protein